MVTQKPRYSEQIENGVLYFVAREIRMVKDIVLTARMSQQSQLRPGDTELP